jgi:uncharacterized protein YkwD
MSLMVRKRCLLLMPILLAGCSASACSTDAPPQRVTEARTFQGEAPRGEAQLQQAALEAHNRARAALGLAPLRWSPALVASARAYAEELARTRRFEHAPHPPGQAPQGENLWTGTRGAYRYDEMFGHWLAEQRYYRAAPTPDFSTSGDYRDVAHYTQIVWRASTEIGCAMASNDRDDYLVCRYLPGGNVVGQMAY